jgi:biotin carboxylase
LWQLEYVRRARQLGLETWVTDWSPTAVARDDADHFEALDLKDREGTLALARRARINAVFTAADIGVPTAAYVAERLGLPGHPPSLAESATNKFMMRQHSRRSGIACPWYRRVRSTTDGTAANRGDARVIGRSITVRAVGSGRSIEGPSMLPCSRRWRPRAVRRQRAASRGTEGSIETLVRDGATIQNHDKRSRC